MKIEVDQSIKIEQTNKDTIIAVAGRGLECTVCIPGVVKRKLQEEFRQQGKPRLFVFRTFIAGVVLLLHTANIKEGAIVTIDEEYSGKELLLTRIFYEMWRSVSHKYITIHFARVGKSSMAHNVAYLTMKGKKEISQTITYRQIKKIV